MPRNNPKQSLEDLYNEVGVTLPSTDPHGTEQDIAQIMGQKTKHGPWTQKGNVIICHGCPFEHGHGIPIDKILTGTSEEGLPMLKKLGTT